MKRGKRGTFLEELLVRIWARHEVRGEAVMLRNPVPVVFKSHNGRAVAYARPDFEGGVLEWLQVGPGQVTSLIRWISDHNVIPIIRHHVREAKENQAGVLRVGAGGITERQVKDLQDASTGGNGAFVDFLAGGKRLYAVPWHRAGRLLRDGQFTEERIKDFLICEDVTSGSLPQLITDGRII